MYEQGNLATALSACEKEADLIDISVLVAEAEFAVATGTIDKLTVCVCWVPLIATCQSNRNGKEHAPTHAHCIIGLALPYDEGGLGF